MNTGGYIVIGAIFKHKAYLGILTVLASCSLTSATQGKVIGGVFCSPDTALV